MKIDIGKNFGEIVKQLEKNGMKTSTIATEIGYTTTTQLYNTIEGRSLLSTKAILRMIDNLDVNPTYIFSEKGICFYLKKLNWIN